MLTQARNPLERAAVSDGQLKIGFILARSFTLSAFALFVDTLRLASDTADKSGRVFADWQVLGSTRHLINSSCGVPVAPDIGFCRTLAIQLHRRGGRIAESRYTSR